MTEQIVAQLQEERDALEQRLEQLDNAILALTGGVPVFTSSTRSSRRTNVSVGADKITAVWEYVRKHGPNVRQADIGKALGYNGGTVSTATYRLEQDGKLVKGPKVDRSPTWSLAK